MNLKQKRAAALKAAQEIVAKAKGESRSLTDEERTEVEAKTAEINDLDAQIEAAEKSDGLMAQISQLGGSAGDAKDGDDKPAKSLGDHFVKSIGGKDGIARLKAHSGMTISSPEFKAATDVHETTEWPTDFVQQVDKTIVAQYRRRPMVADLLGTGRIGQASSIKYYLEGLNVEGGFTTVAQGAQKPQMHFPVPTPVTDDIKKIAAWWDNSDEMFEDLPFVVSEINNRGLYLLAIFEEAQLLQGDGQGTNVLGLLNRSGVQVEAATSVADNADAVFRASTKVQTATGLSSDGVVIHPLDYQKLRLARDANGQYYGGGFFYGEYGNTGVVEQPPLWGMRTVVTASIPQGTFLVGALKAATTVYRKGGVRVESTNSDQGKFTSNIITTRIEERIGLAVRNPTAIVKGAFAPA